MCFQENRKNLLYFGKSARNNLEANINSFKQILVNICLSHTQTLVYFNDQRFVLN